METGERATRELYTDMDDITTWLDTTDRLIDTYEDRERQMNEESTSKDVGEVQEEMVHVVEDIMVSKRIPSMPAIIQKARGNFMMKARR